MKYIKKLILLLSLSCGIFQQANCLNPHKVLNGTKVFFGALGLTAIGFAIHNSYKLITDKAYKESHDRDLERGNNYRGHSASIYLLISGIGLIAFSTID